VPGFHFGKYIITYPVVDKEFVSARLTSRLVYAAAVTELAETKERVISPGSVSSLKVESEDDSTSVPEDV
jgi:hypothetical protein